MFSQNEIEIFFGRVDGAIEQHEIKIDVRMLGAELFQRRGY